MAATIAGETAPATDEDTPCIAPSSASSSEPATMPTTAASKHDEESNSGGLVEPPSTADAERGKRKRPRWLPRQWRPIALAASAVLVGLAVLLPVVFLVVLPSRGDQVQRASASFPTYV